MRDILSIRHLLVSAAACLFAAGCGGSNGGLPIGCADGPSSAVCFKGIAQEVPADALTGWTECWSNGYDASGVASGDILTACDQSYLMLACRQTGSADLKLAAYAAREDVTFDTGDNLDVTHEANGVTWYYHNTRSWGFAPEGAVVNKQTCDYDGSEPTPGDAPYACNDGICLPDPGRRLCWHFNSGATVDGYRCGYNDLSDNPDWEKVILQAE